VRRVIVKLWPGKFEQQKKKRAQEITQAVTSTLNYGEESISIAIEEVQAAEQVYEPDILAKSETLHKEPGYDLATVRHGPAGGDRRFPERHRASVFTAGAHLGISEPSSRYFPFLGR